jgi:hypothetical protein
MKIIYKLMKKNFKDFAQITIQTKSNWISWWIFTILPSMKKYRMNSFKNG